MATSPEAEGVILCIVPLRLCMFGNFCWLAEAVAVNASYSFKLWLFREKITVRKEKRKEEKKPKEKKKEKEEKRKNNTRKKK